MNTLMVHDSFTPYFERREQRLEGVVIVVDRTRPSPKSTRQVDEGRKVERRAAPRRRVKTAV